MPVSRRPVSSALFACRPGPWARHIFGRTLALGAVLLALIAALAAATDEAGSRWGDRAARLAALTPVAASLAVGLVLGQARRRGELRALATAGVDPARASYGACAAAASLGLVAALFLAPSLLPLTSLFPVTSAPPWQRTGTGFFAPAAGLAWELSDSHIHFFAPAPLAAPVPVRPWLCVTSALLAISMPVWAALPEGATRRLAVGLPLTLATLVAFHVVAAGAAPGSLALPALAFIAYLAARVHVLLRPRASA